MNVEIGDGRAIPSKEYIHGIFVAVGINAEFYADFKFVDADLNKCPSQNK
jgi:hypothetical protein